MGATITDNGHHLQYIVSRVVCCSRSYEVSGAALRGSAGGQEITVRLRVLTMALATPDKIIYVATSRRPVDRDSDLY